MFGCQSGEKNICILHSILIQEVWLYRQKLKTSVPVTKLSDGTGIQHQPTSSKVLTGTTAYG